jgi:16S rRNA (adenine1518-N6/adenine1519-N6)-dimethyltransferase
MPPPKITSSIVHLTPREKPLACRVEALETVTRAAFGQRRKMLRQSLKSITPEPGPLIAQAGLEETIRAENVPVEGYVALANAFDARVRA